MATRTLFMASDELVEAVKGFEGCKLTAYKDPRGIPTIGIGHTQGVRMGMRITAAQAESLLRQDMSAAARYVNGLRVCKTQGQFDALVDFAFNLGNRSLGRSTLLYYIRQGKPTAEIQAQFRRWVYAGGKKLVGLVKRREWEARRWASAD